MLSLLAKASMPLLRVSSYGGGVEQKFKPFCIKLVSDWVSFNEDKVTILLLRISAFVILSLFFFSSISFPLFVVRFRSKVSLQMVFCLVFHDVFSLCIGFFEMVLGLYTANRLRAKKFSRGVNSLTFTANDHSIKPGAKKFMPKLNVSDCPLKSQWSASHCMWFVKQK